MAAVSFMPLFFANNLINAIIAGLCVGFGYSGLLATNDLIFARILDHDAATTGIHREGIFLSAFGVLGRLSAIPVSIALLSLGWLFGYHSGDDPGTQAGLAWRVYMSLYPFGLLAIGAVISRFIRVPADISADTPAAPAPLGDTKETEQ